MIYAEVCEKCGRHIHYRNQFNKCRTHLSNEEKEIINIQNVLLQEYMRVKNDGTYPTLIPTEMCCKHIDNTTATFTKIYNGKEIGTLTTNTIFILEKTHQKEMQQ